VALVTTLLEVVLTTNFYISLDARWYNELDIESKIPPYLRDRMVEHHFFAQAVFFEPQFSRARIMMIQYFTALAIIDDTFDIYASLQQLRKVYYIYMFIQPDY